MQFDPSTSALLDSLDTFSGGKITRRNDLGTLIQLSELQHQQELLRDLSFRAKFVSKTYGIMNRIGSTGRGYETLSAEFTTHLEKARSQVQQLVDRAPQEIRNEFAATYFTLSPEALRNLLALLYDLSWYKNWQIDHPGEHT